MALPGWNLFYESLEFPRGHEKSEGITALHKISYMTFNLKNYSVIHRMLSLKSKNELLRELVERCRSVRLRQNLTQAEVAARGGISLSTYQRFERNGQLSLEKFVAVLHALNQVESLEKFLQPPPVSDLRELDLARETRQRARKKP